MALHHREDVSRSGIVGLDADDRITRFQKPSSEAGLFALGQRRDLRS